MSFRFLKPQELIDRLRETIRGLSDAQISYSGLSGLFTLGERVTGGTSGATGEIQTDGAGELLLIKVGGKFQDGETITGNDSGATATADTVTLVNVRIGGAAEFDEVQDRSRLRTPALYVMLAESSATLESVNTSTQQSILHRFSIVLHIDDSSLTETDRRQEYASNVATNMKSALMWSLVGWRPEGFCQARGLYMTGDGGEFADRADYYHVYQFEQEYEFDSSEDGLGELGPYEDLAEFDKLCLDIINKETEPEIIAQIEQEGIYQDP